MYEFLRIAHRDHANLQKVNNPSFEVYDFHRESAAQTEVRFQGG